MDALTGLLDGPRAKGAFLLRSAMNPPWSVRVADEAPLTLVAITKGGAWVVPDGLEPREMRAGDVALLRGPAPYVVADDPATPPQMFIHPGERCTTADGTELYKDFDLGVRSWGNAADGATGMLIGTYRAEGEISRRLLGALPRLAIVPAFDSPLLALLGEEIVRDAPGQDVVLDRLLDLLIIAVLRAWFSRPEAEAPAWYRAHGDPVVGRAMRLLQADPSRPWTVASLATATGVSRATLARRFGDLLGEPPMSFLADLRLTLAADLLREPDATVGSVAGKVGYGTPFALSAAFKRVRGVSPREYRRLAGV